MPTKDELEKDNAALDRKVARLEAKLAEPAKVVTKEVVREVVKEVVKEVPQPLEEPSPVDRRQLYVESHPILGVTRKATVTQDSAGDGRVGDGSTIVRERNG